MILKKSDMKYKVCVSRQFIRALLLTIALFSIPLSSMSYERRTVVVEAVEKVGPAVVNIRTEQIVQRRTSPFFGFGDSFFNDFFSQFAPTRKYRTQALGSGAIIDSSGIVVTNAHVVEKASKIYVALPGERKELEASLVGYDELTDLAVIKVAVESPLPSVSFADYDGLLLGETVIAIGNPLGLENSVTTGVVSAPIRRLPDGKGGVAAFVQTDALINPGNSGGPLLDINGQLIGINTAIAQQAQGIGFAIPVKVVRRVVRELITHGRIRPVYTGLLPGEISRSMVKSRGAGGVLVTEVDPGSPAAGAGIRIADVVLDLGGIQTETASEFLALLKTYPPGSGVSLRLLRGEAELDTTIMLAEPPEHYALQYLSDIFGIVPQEDSRGVFVKSVQPSSPAVRIELKRGDRIAEIEGVVINTLADLESRIEQSLGKIPLKFAIYRGNRGYLIELP